MFLGGKMIIYINCSDKQFSPVKKKQFSKDVPVWKSPTLVCIQNPVVGHLNKKIGRGIVDVVYFDQDLDLRASLCKILISSFAHEMDFAHIFSVDFF